jgi:hypothetical protein
MELNIPQHIQVEQPHPCVLNLSDLREEDLRFGRKLYELAPDRMTGNIAETMRQLLHQQITAVIFSYKKDADLPVGDLATPTRFPHLTSLPHADRALRLLSASSSRPSGTLFTSRGEGLTAMYEALPDSIKGLRSPATDTLKDLSERALAHPIGFALYQDTDEVACFTRDYSTFWQRVGEGNPQLLMGYLQRVYERLDGKSYTHIWQPNTYALFSPLGLHCKRSTTLEAVRHKDPPLSGKDIFVDPSQLLSS